MSRGTNRKLTFDDAKRKLEDLDRWDCLVSCIRKRGGPAIDGMRTAIAKTTNYSERWLSGWTNGKAGFEDKHDPWLLPHAELQKFATESLQISERELQLHRATFFKRIDNLRSHAYTFVGREAQLEKLDRAIEKRARVCLSTSALYGIGGIGKTAIALQYARTRRERYTGVIWLDARADIIDQFHAFVRNEAGLQVKGDGKPGERLADAFEKLAFDLRGRILIVIDDVAAHPSSEAFPSQSERQLELFVRSLPEWLFNRYDLLLTSRHEIRTITMESLQIQRMTREEAQELFLQRSGFARESMDLEKLAGLVDTVLGGHPLAIALLASYARERETSDLDLLAALVRKGLASSEGLRGTTLEEYFGPDGGKACIYATFKMTFDRLSTDTKLLLLALAMFRRGVIEIETVKDCARSMQPATAMVRALRKALCGKGGRTASARQLTRLALAEHVDAKTLSQRAQVRRVQLHEVIYDFVLVQWKEMRADPQWCDVISDLELSFTRGAVTCASEKIDASKIEFRELECLTGLLLPQVRTDLGLLPSHERITLSLNFWYQHFVFQNFVYDTGIQDGLLEPMISLRKYLAERREDNGRLGLILDKLIGHVYYANPGETGKLAQQYFDRALEAAERLDAGHDAQEGEIPVARWYRIFLLDHRTNVASKNRDAGSVALPIRDDPSYVLDFDAIEQALPGSLKDASKMPTEEECELLLRSAHYWGHRGNQDSHIQYHRFLNGSLHGQNDASSVAARDSYMKAANYRLLALKIFRSGQFKRYIASLIRKNEIPLVAAGIETTLTLAPQKRFESFTSLSQGVGDVAHQYRGLHFVFVLDFLASRNADERTTLRRDADRCFNCAELLWERAQQLLTEGEAPLRYRLWMSSSKVLKQLTEDIGSNRTVVPFDVALEQFHASAGAMQGMLRCSYPHSLSQQESQLKAIWKRVSEMS